MGPGDTLGPYIIESAIAEGGMGIVFQAKNRVTGQLRALKVVREQYAQNREFVDRFVREATIASSVRHPNLVETLEPGIENNTIYLPMELLVGETLAARLRRVKRMSPHETATFLAPICEAMQLLHDQKLVHRDLKPANLFIAQVNGREVPKVIDLGTTRDEEDAEHTQTGMVVGSPYYMAPEQAEGRRDVDGRADQYALGVVAYQMVTGARPYESDDTRSALAKLMRGDPYIPPSRVFPGVPAAVELAIVRALSREREARFLRIVDFGRALAMASSGMDTAHTVMNLDDAVDAAKAIIAARPLLTVGGNAETQIRATDAPRAAGVAPTAETAGGFAAPPPAVAPAKAGRGGIIGVVLLGLFAVLAIAGAGGLWWWNAQQAAQIQPHAVQLATTVPSTVVPASVVPPTVIVPPTSIVFSPPATGIAIPPTSVAAPPPSVVAPPPTSVAPPPSSVVARPPPSSTTPPPSSAVRTPPPSTTTSSHPPSTSSGEHHHRPPASSVPCGAATGIPCLE